MLTGLHGLVIDHSNLCLYETYTRTSNLVQFATLFATWILLAMSNYYSARCGFCTLLPVDEVDYRKEHQGGQANQRRKYWLDYGKNIVKNEDIQLCQCHIKKL